MKADAIIWDYDGILLNSVTKNIDITPSARGLAPQPVPAYRQAGNIIE